MNPLDMILKALMSGGGAGENSGVMDMSLSNIGKNLLKKPGKMEEADVSSFISPAKIGGARVGFSGATSQYDPNRIYGGLYQALGGRRVRGGLLGE